MVCTIYYLWNPSGSNYRLFDGNKVELGHFYPAHSFDFSEFGWVKLDKPPVK